MREIRLASGLPIDDRGQALDRLLKESGEGTNEKEPIRLWIEDVQAGDDAMAGKKGFKPYRDLLKMTCSLPLSEPPPEISKTLSLRKFTPADASEFLKVQNRAFDWHPEEADMDLTELARRQSEYWYDPEDFLLLEEGSEIVGFCWTKIHTSPSSDEISSDEMCGEIYMVGVDPAHQGRSLGKLLTYEGFSHLAGRGQTQGMLYVESDNNPAVAIYKKMGMKVASVDRAYLKPGFNELPEGEEKKIFVKQMFNRIAKRYNLMNSILTFGMDSRWRKKALGAAFGGCEKYKTPAEGFVMADLACGTGDFIRQAVKKHGRESHADIQVVGFDFSEEMLSIAQSKIAKSKIAKSKQSATQLGTQLVCADIDNLPVRDNSFDSVTLGFALRNLVDIPTALQEIARVLSFRGRLAILEVGTPKNLLLRKIHSLYFGSIVPLVGRLLSDAPAYGYLPKSVTYLPSNEDLILELKSAGFSEIQVKPLSFGAVNLISATFNQKANM